MFDEISLTIKNSLYKLGIIPELPLYLYARMAEFSYQKDALSPLNAHSWTLISEPNVHPVIYASTSNHENTHVMFVIQGTSCLSDFKGDNISGYMGNAYTEYVNTAKGKVDAYLAANSNITQLSFIGHSMGARISDILGAHYYSNTGYNIRFIRMFDSPGTKDAIKKVESYNPSYPESVNRLDVVSIPNFVNMAGEHLNEVICIPGAYTPPAKPEPENSSEESPPPTEVTPELSPAESARKQIETALNALKFLEDISNKHSIANIAHALSEDNITFRLEKWGTNHTSVLSFAAGRGEAGSNVRNLLSRGVSALTGIDAERINKVTGIAQLAYMEFNGHTECIVEQRNQISNAEPTRINRTLASRLPSYQDMRLLFTVFRGLMFIYMLKCMYKYAEEQCSKILVAIQKGETSEYLDIDKSNIPPICVILINLYYILSKYNEINSTLVQVTPPTRDELTNKEPKIQEAPLDVAEVEPQEAPRTKNPRRSRSCPPPPTSASL